MKDIVQNVCEWTAVWIALWWGCKLAYKLATGRAK